MDDSIVGTSVRESSLGQWLAEQDSFAKPFTQPGQDQEQQSSIAETSELQAGQQHISLGNQSTVQSTGNTTTGVFANEDEPALEDQERSIHVVQSSRKRRFKNRIADLDYAMLPPGPLDLQTCQFLPSHIPVMKVPVVRIYGANEAGQKTCVHVHQVYPYFYVPYEGSLEPTELNGYIHQLGISLNHAAAIAFNTPPQDLRRSQYVAAIIAVRGIPFYGYHVGYKYFLKIYLFNPDLENRIVDLMRSGAVMKTQFQPFEAHIPFRLQFFIDYNLYGMGWLELEDALLRNEVPAASEGDHPKRLTKTSVMDTRIWSPENDPGRISHCEIEMDTTADRIINRDLAPERDTHFSLDECFKPPPSTAQVPSVAGLWEDDVRRRRANNLPSQEPPKTQIREPGSIPWLNHDFNKRMVANLVKEMVQRQSQENSTPKSGDFGNFKIKSDPFAASLLTAYESVEYLCPRIVSDPDESSRHHPQSHLSQDVSFLIEESESSIFVDESIIQTQVATKFGGENMDTKKETFKGLAGLGGIDEQDEDDENFPLPDMDLGDFQEEDLMDEAEWDNMEHFNSDHADSASDDERQYRTDDGPDYRPDEDHIPQFDGGGDLSRGKAGHVERIETDDEKWRKITTRRKRGHSTSTSLSVSNTQSTRVKRSYDQSAATECLEPLTPLTSTRQRSGTGNASLPKSNTPIIHTSTVKSSISPLSKASSPTPSLVQDETPRRLSSDFLRTFHGKYVLDYVEIPKDELISKSSISSSQSRYKRHSSARTAKPVSRLSEEIENDPIEDFDDHQLELGEFDDLPIDESSENEPDIIILDSQSSITKPSADLTSSIHSLASPPSPRNNYFLSTLGEVWSSPSPPMSDFDFFHSPPRPRSPDLIPAYSTPTKPEAPPNSNKRQTTFDSPSIASPLTSPLKSRSLQRKRSSGALSDLSVINETMFISKSDLAELLEEKDPEINDDHNFTKNGNLNIKRSGSQDKPNEILVDDSIILDGVESSIPLKASAVPLLPQQSIEQISQLDLSNFQTASLPAPQESTPLVHNPHLAQLFPSTESSNTHAYQFSISPPTTKSLMLSLPHFGLPNHVHQKPYYSNETDVPSKSKVFGGKEFRLQSKGLKSMPHFKSRFDVHKDISPEEGYQHWEPSLRPPSFGEALEWIKEDEERIKASLRSAAEASTQQKRQKISQIEGPTPKNPFGCKNSPTKVAASIAIEKDFLDVLSVEVHCQTRGGLLPDPKVDPILAVFYCWQADREDITSNGWVPGFHVGIITHQEAGMLGKLALGPLSASIEVVTDEGAMLDAVINLVLRLDPDILAGYEVHNLSWGYLVDRYQAMFSMDMTKLISRIRSLRPPLLSKSAMEAQNSFNSRKNSGLKIVGRHVFNVWRLIRGEVALTNYGYTNVVFHVLQQRIPHYSHETLTKWWSDGSPLHQCRVIKNYIHRVQYVLQLIESQELISRTSEFARVFGVDFFSVISRGSQYKVESLMIRLSKPENYIMISPSRAQVGAQRAAEVIPMVMEPESGFYEDPIVVLDFQSLYPSVMIAYNYCYSTCLGKLGGGTKLGVRTDYTVQDGILPLMQEHLQLAPNNVMYVNQDIRQSLLARMLSEILDTRIMVKKAMKEYPDNKSLLKLLDARQLSLKLLANVTYGYTCASYSGRMPGVEIADSIVLSARETLERSIRFVNENPKWNARVVYGDTDSMFVQLKGRTRQEAFEIGYDISETITKMNPRPVKLKFEKVYHPCFLVTKKRYVGSSYETPDQVEPIFDAKGIETIRRDGVPAVQKIMETCIKTMFRTQDLSLVKSYVVRQLGKILEGRVPVPDLMFGKEVKLGRYSEKGVPPPGAIVSERRMELDPRSEPQYGERVPYVVVYGDPSARLTDQVVEPKELLRNKNLRLNGEYYIRKHVIPSLERIFQLAGADVKSWYDEMPRIQKAIPMTALGAAAVGRTSAPSAANVVPNEEMAAVLAAQHHQPALGTNHNGQSENPSVTETGIGGSNEGTVGLPIGPVAPLGPPKFKPKRRRGGKGFVSIGSRIDRYYQSQSCIVCGKTVSGKKPGSDVCTECMSEHGHVKSIFTMQNRLSNAEKLFRATMDICSSCCRAAPSGGAGVIGVNRSIGVGIEKGSSSDTSTTSLAGVGFVLGVPGGDTTGTELIACESLECSVFWQRRKAQDAVVVARHQTAKFMQEVDELDF